MNIQDAVKQAISENSYIVRSNDSRIRELTMIKPTDSSDCCIVFIKDKPSVRRWNPKADDLIADDWEVVKTIHEVL